MNADGEPIANDFQIDEVLVDIVYGVGEIEDNVFSHKSSLTWLESKTGVKYSGAPGYLKGKPLLIGSQVYKLDKTTVIYDPNGFALRGANNKGECYFVNKN